MPRTKLRKDTDYYLHESDPIELDEVDDLGYRDGTNGKVDKVHTPDVLCDHAFNDTYSINFGVQKHQYQVNNEIDETIVMEQQVNKGRNTGERVFSSKELTRRLEEILGDFDDE